jgi:BNR repeat-like domain
MTQGQRMLVASLVIAAACLTLGASLREGSRSNRIGRDSITRLRVRNVDVSRAAGSQAEVRIAADPRNSSRLLAASNSDSDPGMRVYSSSDGGRSWRSEVLPRPSGSPPMPCHADPAPAIDDSGNEYVTFMQAAESCDEGGEHVTLRLAIRLAGEGSWHYWSQSAIHADERGSFDDNPWLAIDTGADSPHAGRLYLGWFRSVAGRRLGFEISHSDDHGAHWSEPQLTSDSVDDAGYPSLSVADDGVVYAAWHDFGRGALFLDRSTDGGETFGPDIRLPLRGRDAANCPNGRPIAAQPLRCVRSDPTVIADAERDRVYLTYSDLAPNGSEDVFVAAYDRRLNAVSGFPRRIGTRERQASDQFWPTSALDPRSGRLVLCFYATGTGMARTRATFSCAVSDALAARWSPAQRIATVASDETRPRASEFAYGDYEGVAVAGGIAHPIWTDSRDLAIRGEEIYTAAVPVEALAAGTTEREVDVSNAAGSQNEPAIAVDPTNPDILIASSNSLVSPMSVYTSTDGGLSWSAQAVPPDRPPGICLGDPAVTIDTRGRQYFAFLRDVPCGSNDAPTGLMVATRSGPRERWRLPTDSLAGALRSTESNDKPAITADTSPQSPHNDQVYVAWARAVDSHVHAIVVSHSDDGGRTWSTPVRVDDSSVDSGYPSIATGPEGEVYVAWHPFEEDRIVIAASFDGGRTFGSARTIDVKRNRSSCPASWPIPAQATRCVRPNPIVTVDSTRGRYRGRVYVTYENKGSDGTQDVFLAAFNRLLAPLLGAPTGRRLSVAPLRYRSDQFWPASAVDQRSGTLWVCFYDTAGDKARHLTWFSCTRSRDGARNWTPIARVARVPSNATGGWVSPFQYGDYEGLAVANGVAHPIWTDTRLGRTSLSEEIFTTRVRD